MKRFLNDTRERIVKVEGAERCPFGLVFRQLDRESFLWNFLSFFHRDIISTFEPENQQVGESPDPRALVIKFKFYKMNNIQIFNHEMFGEIRTMTDERGETFFVGKDIAEALGYAKSRNALAAHVDAEDKKDALIQGPLGGTQTMTVINESGFYALVLSSKLPQAKAFKRWVTSEVLPQIRKTGAYVSQKKQIENLIRHIEELEPKAEYCDEVLESVSCFTTTQIAKELSMTVHDLTRLLEQRKVMYKQSGQWMLYADYARKGYAKSRTHTHYDAEGDLHTRTYLVWTEEGRRFIHRICSDEEIMIPFMFSVTITD